MRYPGRVKRYAANLALIMRWEQGDIDLNVKADVLAVADAIYAFGLQRSSARHGRFLQFANAEFGWTPPRV